MAYDPIQEDCLRLILGALHREHIYPLENAAFIARCMEDYHRDPAKLIVSDTDRSFHLVALATETIDYRLPFVANDAEVDRLSVAAEAQLREACQLDPKNWDAQRMLAALSSSSNDEYVSYLLEHRAEVEEAIRQDERTARDPYSQEYMRDLGKRGLVRWLAALASRALISGRYRLPGSSSPSLPSPITNSISRVPRACCAPSSLRTKPPPKPSIFRRSSPMASSVA